MDTLNTTTTAPEELAKDAGERLDKAHATIKQGCEYPYDDRPTGQDVDRRAALGVMANLMDRGGINNALEDVDAETRREIVDDVTDIIHYGRVMPDVVGTFKDGEEDDSQG